MSGEVAAQRRLPLRELRPTLRGTQPMDGWTLSTLVRQTEPQTKKRSGRATPRQKRWPEFSIEQILAWADAHYARTGQWPRKDTGFIREAPREKWQSVDNALRLGLRSLQRGSSLARLLDTHRGVRNRKNLPRLKPIQILAWADLHYARTESWPTVHSGPIMDAPGETWMAVEMALTKGLRGLPGGSSLPQLLDKHRQVRNKHDLPLLTVPQILTWADEYHDRVGAWPNSESGLIENSGGESWCAINQALYRGTRGLPGGSSLACLLEERRGVPNRLNRPRLTLEQILAWADAYHARTGRWPTHSSGAIPEAPGERWSMVDTCMIQGNRGLPGGHSLARLLVHERGARKRGKPVRVLTEELVLAWADRHHQETGRWPTRATGPVGAAPEESWNGIDLALARGGRGLPGGSSLAKLLVQHRGAQSRNSLPPLSEERILAWADAHHQRTGRWPTVDAGLIEGGDGSTWNAVQRALADGRRGLPGGSSLARLLEVERGVPKDRPLRPLTGAQLLEWVDAHYARTGQWPTMKSGAITDAPGENWAALNQCLVKGWRTLPGSTTLLRFLAEHRGVPHPSDRPDLTFCQILAWADGFHARHGRWPRVLDGAIEDAPGENWLGMENALRMGLRGLPGGSSLHKLIRAHRR
jgi:hypothetical protein